MLITKKDFKNDLEFKSRLKAAFYQASSDAIFDQKVIAAVRGCSTYTLERDRWAGGEIPYIKIKRAVRYRKADVLTWLGQYQPQQSTSDVVVA